MGEFSTENAENVQGAPGGARDPVGPDVEWLFASCTLDVEVRGAPKELIGMVGY
jgi:hypothetical protein